MADFKPHTDDCACVNPMAHEEADKRQAAKKASKSKFQIVTRNQIKMYLHCGKCITELMAQDAPKIPPRDWARLSIGWTPQGFQVWCERHDMNVGNFDLRGRQIEYATEEKP